jgi:hypothetical protein
MNITKCNLCNDEAIAIFYFNNGCICNEKNTQPLCLHHAHKSRPAGKGSMELIVDLTVSGIFTDYWNSRIL